MVAVAVNAARPLDAQGEVNLTSNGVAMGAPPTETVTLMPVVPKADRFGVCTVTGLSVTLAAPTE